MNLKQAFEVIGRDIKNLMSKFSDYIPNNAKSDAITSNSSKTVATSRAINDLYNLIKEKVVCSTSYRWLRKPSKEGFFYDVCSTSYRWLRKNCEIICIVYQN
ncbi:TPA: hypothetical protein RNX40_001692 [Pasteurella multocida]|nr:hypothetical protein [Pasteurella multocida]